MSKLQNIKAVKQLIAGTHKTQTKKMFAMGSTKQQVSEDDIIERFEDGKPKVWIETDAKGFRTRITQHDGFKSREPENSVLKTVQEALKVPEECPCCGANMRAKERKLNFKFYHSHGKCFDCVLIDERRIRAKGPEAWKEYQNKIMLANAEGWFKDADKEVEILKTSVKETVWGNADGETGEVDTTEFVNKMEKDYEKLKEDIRSKFLG